MDRLGDQLLSRPALALDQDGDIRLGDLLDDRFDLGHLGVIGKEKAENFLHNRCSRQKPSPRMAKKSSPALGGILFTAPSQWTYSAIQMPLANLFPLIFPNILNSRLFLFVIPIPLLTSDLKKGKFLE